jgi:8-oxo-dGTP pyrophosphatase MutT (NUDIX family)|tara:strand:- start:189 stop:947 length:759 start_codon:yes stop_codon:yes gene_type:complete
MINLKNILENKDSKHAAGIAYVVGDEMLCVQNTNGRWEIPKGHIQVDETPEEGAHREFTEETQIMLSKPIKFSHKAKKSNGGDFHVFTCKGDKKITAHIGHEHIDWGYYKINELPEPFDDRVIKVVDNLTESLLLERVDYHEIASSLVKKYGLKSKIQFTRGKDLADYDWITDTINLRPSYPTMKRFLVTVLHEIKHALDRKKLGVKRYERLYSIAGEMAVQKGGDFHDDNKFEEEAERWGKREYLKVKNKL